MEDFLDSEKLQGLFVKDSFGLGLGQGVFIRTSIFPGLEGPVGPALTWTTPMHSSQALQLPNDFPVHSS